MLYRPLMLLMLLISVSLFAGEAFAAPEHLVIIYEGDTRGYVEGCGWKAMQGGLARRAGLIDGLKKQETNILLVDVGDSFSVEKNVPELRAEISMEGLSLMKYDALNLADGELSLGLEFLQKVRDKAQFPLVSANIFKKGESQPMGNPYVVKKFKGFRVGIVGLASSVYFNKDLVARENLEIKEPEETLREVLPQVLREADLVVLLSHLGKVATRNLVQKVPGIDVAIIGHDSAIMNEPELMGKTILVQCSLRGEFLGILDLTVDEKGAIQTHQGRVDRIVQTTPCDPEVLALLRTFEEKKAAIDREKLAEKQKQEVERRLREGLKMTPEEYFEKMKQEQQVSPTPGEVFPPEVKEKSK